MHEYYFIAEPDKPVKTVTAYVGRSNPAAIELSLKSKSPLVAPLVAYTPLPGSNEAIYQIPPYFAPLAQTTDIDLLLEVADQLERAGVVYGDGAIFWDILRRIPVFADWQHAIYTQEKDAVLHMGPLSVDFALVPPPGTALSATNLRNICALYCEPWEPYRPLIGMPRDTAIAWLSARPGLDRRRIGRYLLAFKDHNSHNRPMRIGDDIKVASKEKSVRNTTNGIGMERARQKGLSGGQGQEPEL